MDNNEISHLKSLLSIHVRRKQELQQKDALKGIDSDPATKLEIENIEEQIQEIKQKIAELDPDITPTTKPVFEAERTVILPTKPFRRLIGRQKWVSELMDILRNPDGPPMLSITGIGGIGKTALALELADLALQQELFEDVVWFSAKQRVLLTNQIKNLQTGLSTYSDILDQIQRQLLSPDKYPGYDRNERIRRLLKSKPFLIVIDNLETLQDQAALLNSFPDFLKPSRAILTGRLTSFTDYIYPVTISGLEERYSTELIRQEAEDKQVPELANAEYEMLQSIHQETEGMPLAIKLVVGEIKSGLDIETVLERLKTAENEEDLYRFIYFDLWNTLSDSAQQVLVLMPGFATSVNRQMLYYASELTSHEFDNAIMELVQKSLLEVSKNITIDQRRYSIHALTRNFINSDLTELFKQQDE